MKKIFLLLLIGIFGVALGGCNKEEEGSDKVTSISFFGWGSDEEQKNFQALINRFNAENPDIMASYSASSSTTYMTNLKNKSKNLPDVFYMPDYEFMAWASEGKLLELDSYVTEEELNSVWDLSTDMYRFDDKTLSLGSGNLYGLPKDLGPFTLVYNKTLIEKIIKEKNLDLELPSDTNPMTFSEFAEYLKKLKYTNADNRKVYGISHYELNAAVYSNNADFWNEEVTTSKLNDKNLQDAIQYIADLSLVHDVMPGASEQASISGYDRFLNSGCLFTFMGPWDMKAFWETANFEFDICPVPVGEAEGAESTAWIGSVAYAVSAKTKKKEAALRLVKWLTFNEGAQTDNYKLGQAIPNLKEMALNDFIQGVGLTGVQLQPANRHVWVDIVTGTDKIKGKNRANYFLYDNSCYNELLDKLEPVYTGAKTASEFLNSYHTTFQKGLDENNSYLK